MTSTVIKIIVFIMSTSLLSVPTYAELIGFLNKDNVNKNRYVENEYVCWNYACDLMNNANEANINMFYIQLAGPGINHALVATMTSDKGIVFIEPQLDRPAYVVDGFNYWSWFYGPHTTADGTIQDILIYEGAARCDYLKEQQEAIRITKLLFPGIMEK